MNLNEFNKEITHDVSDTKSGHFRLSYYEFETSYLVCLTYAIIWKDCENKLNVTFSLTKTMRSSCNHESDNINKHRSKHPVTS